MKNATEMNEKLEESKKYIGNAWFIMVYNFEQFMPKQFGDNTIEQKSSIVKRQFSAKTPEFAYVPVSIDSVEDEDAIMNVGV